MSSPSTSTKRTLESREPSCAPSDGETTVGSIGEEQNPKKIKLDPEVKHLEDEAIKDAAPADDKTAMYEHYDEDGFRLERPRDAMFHRNAINALGLLQDTVEGCIADYHLVKTRSSDLINLRASFDTIKEDLRNPASRLPFLKVAIMGVTGVGKSLLLSCLCELFGLALSSHGDRGTYLPQEYVPLAGGRETPYFIRAIYCDTAEISKRFGTWYQQICEYIRFQGQQSDDTDGASDFDDTDMDEDLIAKYHVAIGKICCVLNGFDDFKDTDVALEWFTSRIDEPEDEIIKQLLANVDRFLKDRGVESGEEQHPASDLKELHEVLARVAMPEETPAEPHPAPILEMVKIEVFNALTREGVILADTAGTADTDQTVVKSTLNYLTKNAELALVVGEIPRCNTNKELDDLFMKCIKLDKQSRTWFVPSKMENTSKLTPQEQKHLNTDIQEMYLATQNAPQDRSQRQVGHRIQIHARNKATMSQMSKKLQILSRATAKSPKLPVFFTSASFFEKSYTTPKDKLLLSREDTGIPYLQRKLLTVAARKRFAFLRSLASKAEAYLNTIVGTLHNATQDRRSTVDRYLQHMQKLEPVLENANEGIITYVRDELLQAFARRISGAFDENLPAWIEKSKGIPESWQKKVPNTARFRKYIKESGMWKLQRNGKITSWNEDLIKVIRPKLDAAFNELLADITSIQTQTSEQVKQCCEAVLRATQGDISKDNDFCNAIFRNRDNLIQSCHERFDQLEAILRRLRNKVLTDDTVLPSFVRESMSKTYKVVAAIESKDQTEVAKWKRAPFAQKKRVQTLTDRLTTPGEANVYRGALVLTKKRFHKEILGKDSWIVGLQDDVKKAHKDHLEEFTRRYEPPKNTTEQSQAELLVLLGKMKERQVSLEKIADLLTSAEEAAAQQEPENRQPWEDWTFKDE